MSVENKLGDVETFMCLVKDTV